MQWEKKFLYNKECEDHYRIACPRCGYTEEVIMDKEEGMSKNQNYCPRCGEYLRETEDCTARRMQRMERNARRKSDEIKRQDKWIKHLQEQFTAERNKIYGYEEMAKVYSAYIYILLQKLGATKDNAVDIKLSEAEEALTKGETRATKTEDGWGLYYEEYKV